MALTPLTDGMSGLDCRTNINASFTQVDANVTAIAERLPLTGGTLTGPLAINGGTVTDSTPLLAISQTWNDGTKAFKVKTTAITNTAIKAYSETWADVSTVDELAVGGVVKYALIPVGSESQPMIRLGGSDAYHPLLKADGSGFIIRGSGLIDMVAMGFHSTQFGITVAGSMVGGLYKGVIGFNQSANVMGGGNATADAFFASYAAASIQMGINSATPIAQLFKGPAGVGTNIAGGDLSLAAGQSTGNASAALLRLKGTAPGSTGATEQTYSDHLLVGGELVEVETGIAFQLGNEAVSETPSATHTLIVKDSSGTSYRLLCTPI